MIFFDIPPSQKEATMSYEEMRKHIHELANHLFIAEGSVNMVMNQLVKKCPELETEIARLKKASEYIQKSNQTLQNLRDNSN